MPEPALPARCFYCALWMGEEDDPVYGVRVVAHRSCVHEQVAGYLRAMYPARPEPRTGTAGQPPGPTKKFLAQCGITEKELWG